MDLYGLILLTLVLIVISALMTATLFGVLYALHRVAPEHFPITTVGEFDLENIRRAPLSEFLGRLAATVFAPTILLHLLEFMMVGVYIHAHPALTCSILMILETAALAAGFHFFLKLDPRRTIALAASAVFVYAILLWLVIYASLQ